MNILKNPSQPIERAESLTEPPALPGRWTICAMLFVATTINYVDRQVLSILKPVLAGSTLHLVPYIHGWPTVESSIRMNEIQYGYIVDCFQIAYALGVIFAGRLVDRLGCRRGYPLITGVWSIAAMSHALVNSVSGFGVARFSWDSVRAATSCRDQGDGGVVSPQRACLATGIFNSGAGVGAIVAPLVVPWVALHFGWRASFLVTGTFSAIWIVWWSVRYRKPRESMDEAAAFSCRYPSRSSPGGNCLAIGRPGDSHWANSSPIRSGGSIFSGCPSLIHASNWICRTSAPIGRGLCRSTIGSIGGGWLPRGYVRLGMQLKSARLAAMLTCACLVVPIMLAGGLHSEWTAVGLLSLGLRPLTRLVGPISSQPPRICFPQRWLEPW